MAASKLKYSLTADILKMYKFESLIVYQNYTSSYTGHSYYSVLNCETCRCDEGRDAASRR